MTIKEQYEIYRIIATRLDFVTIGINICLLIILSLQKLPTAKKIQRAFYRHIIVSIVVVGSEIVGWISLFKPEYLAAFKISYFVSVQLNWIIPITVFSVIINVLDYKVTFDKRARKVLLAIFLLNACLLFIPSFRDMIYTINEEYIYGTNGPWLAEWFLIEFALMAVGIVYGFTKCKAVGFLDTAVVSVFILIPFVGVPLDYWWAATVSYLFMAFSSLVLYGVTYQNRLTHFFNLNAEKKIEVSEMKTKLLLSQIKPHFIYNTLTTIKFLCETDPKKASDLCDNFASFLRSNIDSIDDQSLIPLSRELSNTENYLKIEQARFGDRVKYTIDIKSSDFLVPPLSVQTLVENSVKNGICKKKDGGTVEISSFEDDDSYIVRIHDDGIGFDENAPLPKEKSHVGLKNARARMDHEVGGKILISSSLGKGATIDMVIPKKK